MPPRWFNRCFQLLLNAGARLPETFGLSSSRAVRSGKSVGTTLFFCSMLWVNGKSCNRKVRACCWPAIAPSGRIPKRLWDRSEEHTSELQSLRHLVCRLLLEKKKNTLPCSFRNRFPIQHLDARVLTVTL